MIYEYITPDPSDYIMCNKCGYFVGICLCHKGIFSKVFFDGERPVCYFKIYCELCKARTWHFKSFHYNDQIYGLVCFEHSWEDKN